MGTVNTGVETEFFVLTFSQKKSDGTAGVGSTGLGFRGSGVEGQGRLWGAETVENKSRAPRQKKIAGA